MIYSCQIYHHSNFIFLLHIHEIKRAVQKTQFPSFTLRIQISIYAPVLEIQNKDCFITLKIMNFENMLHFSPIFCSYNMQTTQSSDYLSFIESRF